ncbi:MAG TPA: MFS transporter [Granulicella sp.]|jgi:sugar phosphate permease
MAALESPPKVEVEKPEIEMDRRSYWSARIFVAAWIGYAGFYFCRKNIAWTPLPATSKHAWLGGFADLLMFFSLGYVLGQIIGGWASDRFGGRRTLLCGGLLSLTVTAFLALGLPISVVMMLQVLNGLGQGFGWPAINKLFSIWLPRHSLAIGMAWWSTSYALGSFLATALATALSTADSIPIQTGLRLSILVPSGVLLVTTCFFFWRSRDLPSDAGIEPINSNLPLAAHTSSWKSVLCNGELQLLATMYFFLKLTRYSLLFWLPVYLIESQHATGRSALKLSSLFELVGFVGALLAAYISDRLLDGRRYPVGATMLFLAAFVFLLHPIISTAGTVAVGISISVIGILIFGPDVLISSTAVLEAVPPEQAGRASGYVNGVGSLGQMLSPLLITLCIRWFGWNSIFNLFVVCSLIAAALLAKRWNIRRPFSELLATQEATLS